MLVIILLLGMMAVEMSLAVLSIRKQSAIQIKRAYIRLAELLAFVLLVLSPIIKWSFRWYMLSAWLVIVTIIALAGVYRNKKKQPKKLGIIIQTILKGIVIAFVCIPPFIFPQDSSIKPDGNYGMDSVIYTWTDRTRDEAFTKEADHRNITATIFYPTENADSKKKAEGRSPLIIFSHGAFGVSSSNESTYNELVSHGYVVCAIDHTYHSFVTKEASGKIILCDPDFMQKALTISNEEDSIEKYNTSQGWYQLRADDIIFCLDQIKAGVNGNLEKEDQEVFSMIDIGNIGLMGHSLGGAAAAGAARREDDIKAVAVIDGTMFGEETGFENGREVITNEPYPVPLLNFYNGASYKVIAAIKDQYPNTIASKSQERSYQIAIMNAGHMNFTDLTLFSPILADQLNNICETEAEKIDSRACLKYMNGKILNFFDGYLKGKEVDLPKELAVTIE